MTIANHFKTALVVFVAFVVTTTARGDDPAKPKSSQVAAITSVAVERLLDYPLLWDQECLYNHQLFGLRFGTEKNHTLRFFYGSVDPWMPLKRGSITALAEIPVRNGHLHGKLRRWSADGTLLLEVPFVRGKIHGECRCYSDGGKLLGTSTLRNGTGTYKVWAAWREDPTLVREIVYVNGKRISSRPFE